MQSETICKAINDAQNEKQRNLVQSRIEDKCVDYKHYHFNLEQIHALAIFFDLAQEFNTLEDLYALSVYMPKLIFGRDTNLYILDKNDQFVLQATTLEASCVTTIWEEPESFALLPGRRGTRFMVPVKCKHLRASQLPFNPRNNDIIGILELETPDPLPEHERFFFEKYANRVGFQTHNKILSITNQEHLSFIKNLVQDIGHNVIVPNMYFKLLFNTLRTKLADLKTRIVDLTWQIENTTHHENKSVLDTAVSSLDKTSRELTNHCGEMYSHYMRSSLFLETLLRRSHFEKGRYVLLKQACNFKKKIIAPQLKHFLPLFHEKGILVDMHLGGIPDKNIIMVADIGLLSQVFANLFSNAAKYTREVEGPDGTKHKFVSYGWEKLPNYFGPGKHAIKPNVFSTGPHIPEEERAFLFDSDFRCKAAKTEPGSGHGLFFIKQIVELHGGIAGYEATALGNNFYIILPSAE